MKSLALLSLAALISVGATAPTLAEDASAWPSKPITLVVPYPPGGGATIATRMLQQPLTEALGQPIIVDNRPGGVGDIGYFEVAKSAPDGYTFLVMTTTNVVRPATLEKKPYDNLTDYDPVSFMLRNSSILVVHPSVPANTTQEFIDLLKKDPDKYSCGNAGVGGINHLTATLFKQLTGTKFVDVPYQGSGPLVADLLAGNVQCTFESPETIMTYIKAGSVRALGVAATEKMPSAPDIPLLSDVVPGLVNISFTGLAAPKGTPQAIIDKMSAAVVAAYNTPELQKTLDTMASSGGSSPQEFGGALKSEEDKWHKVATDAGISFKE